MPSSLDDPAARSFVDRLGALDEQLSLRERQLLRALLLAASDPLDRRTHLGAGFTDDQQAVLDRLESGVGHGESAPQP